MAYKEITDEVNGVVVLPDQIVVTGVQVLDWRGSPLGIRWNTEINQTMNKGDVFKLTVVVKF